jgi:DNA-binding transcriptional ArsR family regulator
MAIDDEARAEVRRLHAVFCEAMSDPRRLLIMRALGDASRTTAELERAVGLDEASLRGHLGILVSCGLVAIVGDTNDRYRLVSPKILVAVDLLFDVMTESGQAGSVGALR